MQQMDLFQDWQYGRTSQEPSTPTRALTSGSSSTKWLTQGLWLSSGQCWMRSTSESPSDEGASSCVLSSILAPQSEVPSRYYLSARACAGILRRAKRRNKTLPPRLKAALQAVVDKNPDWDKGNSISE